MKKVFVLAAAALALAACDQNNENQDASPVAARIMGTIGESAVTRASDTSWAAGDAIGISSTVSGVAKPYVNVQYTTEKGNGEFKGTLLYFYKPMVLTAYYPFTGTEGTVPGNNGIIEASTSAENQTAAEQPKIDFLWDSQTGFTAADPNVNFTFAHKMCRLTFTFLDSERTEDTGPVDVGTIVQYEIDGLKLDGTFNTASGVCAVKDVAAKTLSIELQKGTAQTGVAVPSLIVFPQKPGNDVVKLHVRTDELGSGAPLQHYTCMLNFVGGELKPGCHYKYTIQVTKRGLKVGEISIVDWAGQDVKLQATIE